MTTIWDEYWLVITSPRIRLPNFNKKKNISLEFFFIQQSDVVNIMTEEKSVTLNTKLRLSLRVLTLMRRLIMNQICSQATIT